MGRNRYTPGQLVTVSFTFETAAGAAYDPESVFFTCIDPAGETTELEYGADVELVRDGVGEYHVDVSADIPGEYRYRAYATGDGQAAIEDSFTVKESEFV